MTLLALATLCAPAQAGQLFESDDVLNVELRAPFSALYSERKQDVREEMPGVLSVLSGDEGRQFDVGVVTRGNFRRTQCRYAPLRLNFKKKQVEDTLFDGENKLKLVSPCRAGRRYEEIIVAEYMVYRVFEILSEHHFRVRPLNVRFVNDDGKARESFAFLIEDLDDMAARYGRMVPDWESTEFQRLRPEARAIVELFQFMVGGHDWSVVAASPGNRCCHNSRLIVREGEQSDIVPVPYDFDLTGLVNAPYAFPPESLPIKSVRQRYFRGRCQSQELWTRTIDHFRERRAAINAAYNDTHVSAKTRKRSLRYLDQFYEIIDDPKRRQRMIMDRCQQIPR